MRTFCFTVDDNIRVFKELTEGNFPSLFEHPYLAMLRRLHERFDLKIQLNLFYRTEGFDLSRMTEKYTEEFETASDWLKLSFHSDVENVCPYESSGYTEVFGHCSAVNGQILRFASQKTLARTTTVHYCRTTQEGLRALSDNSVLGLLGLFGTEVQPRTSYGICEEHARDLRCGRTVKLEGMSYASIDMVINTVKREKILPLLEGLLGRESIRVMIHEQYFYEDYHAYQPDFEEKLVAVFEFLGQNGYESCFFEELID